MTDEIILDELKHQIPAWDSSIKLYSKKLKECEEGKARALRLITLLEEKINNHGEASST